MERKIGKSGVPWKDDLGREILNRDPGPGTLRQQLKERGTPEEKEWIRRIEAQESAIRERRRQERIQAGQHQQSDFEKSEIIPDFNKHDLKKDW